MACFKEVISVEDVKLSGSFVLSIIFPCRGPVVRVDSAGPSTGSILLSPDKRRVVWNIGQYIQQTVKP